MSYTARAANADLNARYIPLLPVNQRIQHERDRALAYMLRQHLSVPPAQARVLEVGCGSGSNLLDLIRLGFDPANLMGNDLMDSRVEQARHRLPQAVPILAGNALDLDLEREGFDVLYQSTVFTSILDAQARRDLGATDGTGPNQAAACCGTTSPITTRATPNVRRTAARSTRAVPHARIHTARITLAPALGASPARHTVRTCQQPVPVPAHPFAVLDRQTRRALTTARRTIVAGPAPATLFPSSHHPLLQRGARARLPCLCCCAPAPAHPPLENPQTLPHIEAQQWGHKNSKP